MTVPVRVERPSNVTSEFCAMHDRLSVLNFARISVPSRGTVKFVWDCCNSRGTAWPRVTLLKLVEVEFPERLVVVQPVAPATVQVCPVNPFIQMQEQTFCDTTLVPPFSHLS